MVKQESRTVMYDTLNEFRDRVTARQGGSCIM